MYQYHTVQPAYGYSIQYRTVYCMVIVLSSSFFTPYATLASRSDLPTDVRCFLQSPRFGSLHRSRSARAACRNLAGQAHEVRGKPHGRFQTTRWTSAGWPKLVSAAEEWASAWLCLFFFWSDTFPLFYVTHSVLLPHYFFWCFNTCA